ncbi:Uncharacterised protein [uncultured archaeon]|nr:Uncharacterised protein [uncultured archaeon]
MSWINNTYGKIMHNIDGNLYSIGQLIEHAKESGSSVDVHVNYLNKSTPKRYNYRGEIVLSINDGKKMGAHFDTDQVLLGRIAIYNAASGVLKNVLIVNEVPLKGDTVWLLDTSNPRNVLDKKVNPTKFFEFSENRRKETYRIIDEGAEKIVNRTPTSCDLEHKIYEMLRFE